MKYCQKCGREIFDEAIVCPGCGCAVGNGEIKTEKQTSTFKKNNMQWIIIVSILFLVFAGVAILLLTSDGFVRASDQYRYLHSDYGQLGKRISASGAIEWQQKVDDVKDTLTSYYVGIGVCGVLALTALVGDILLFFNRKKVK